MEGRTRKTGWLLPQTSLVLIAMVPLLMLIEPLSAQDRPKIEIVPLIPHAVPRPMVPAYCRAVKTGHSSCGTRETPADNAAGNRQLVAGTQVRVIGSVGTWAIIAATARSSAMCRKVPCFGCNENFAMSGRDQRHAG
jgi:hypothetical protein